MREIKFRFWSNDKEEGGMMEPSDNLFVGSRGKVYIGNYEGKTIEVDYIPMQFTGLKDKNGKEIYGGDIFGHRTLEDGKMNVIEGAVTWNDRLAQWEVAEGLMIWALRKDAEVIGNIYENPELLET